MKVLLIGGEGYIGNIISEYLLSKGYEVVSFDSFQYKNNLMSLNHVHHDRYSFKYGDMREPAQVSAAMENVDAVILLAGLVGDPITRKYPEESEQINVKGVRQTIDAAFRAKVKRLIFVSTCSNYGLIEGDQRADENFSLNPLSAYAVAKVDTEQYLLSMKGKVETNVTILRFATAFGLSPRMRFDLTINEFTYALAAGRELVVYDADTWRPYCHVKDFARLTEIVLREDKEKISFQVFNAGGEENNYTKRMIVEAVQQYVASAQIIFQEQGQDTRNYRVNFDKVKSVLGFVPKFSVDDGIREVIEAFEQHILDDVAKHPEEYGNYSIEG